MWGTSKYSWMGIFIITTITALTYLNSLNVPFNFDDVSGIVNNRSIQIQAISLAEIKHAMNNTRPVSDLTFALNYHFGGLNVLGYHVVNVMIHCVTAVLVYIFLLKTLPHSPAIFPLLGGLLWAVHPIHTQAVTYVIQRMTGLATLFFMLSLVLYIQGRRISGMKGFWLYLLAVVSGLLGMGSKEIVVTLPLVILLYEFYFRANFDPSFLKGLWKYWLPLLGVTLVFIQAYFAQRGGLIHGLHTLLTSHMSNESFTGTERLLTESRVIMFYLSLLILPLPSRLNLDHDFALSTSLFNPLTTFLSVISIFGLILYAIWVAKKYPIVSFGILWFFINLALESTFIRLDLIFEHRLYLPSIGLVLVLSWTLMKISQSGIFWPATGFDTSTSTHTKASGNLREAPLFLFSLLNFLGLNSGGPKRRMIVQTGMLLITFGLVGFYSGATLVRNALWQDSIRLWTDIANKSPNKARVHNNLGLLYLIRGELEPARQEFEQAIRLAPEFLLFRNNLATVYQNQGKIQEAIRVYQEALKVNPFDSEIHEKIGKIYLRDGRLDLATLSIEKAIALGSDRPMTYSLLGQAYQKSGYTEKAALAYEQALRLIRENVFKPRISHSLMEPAETPDKPSLHYELGNIYENLEKPDLAIQHYQEAVRAFPLFVPARMRLSLLYKKTGRMDLAEREFQEIMNEDPTYLERMGLPDKSHREQK